MSKIKTLALVIYLLGFCSQDLWAAKRRPANDGPSVKISKEYYEKLLEIYKDTKKEKELYRNVFSFNPLFFSTGYYLIDRSDEVNRVRQNKKSFNFGFSYSYAINKYIQFRFATKYFNSKAVNDKTSTFAMLFGPTFNFRLFEKVTKQSRSWWFGILVGTEKLKVDTTAVKNSESYMRYMLELGKRFEVANNVSFSPSIGIDHRDLPPKEDSYFLNLLHFDIFF